MADLDLWTENRTLSNFAEDTQSIIVIYYKTEVGITGCSRASRVRNVYKSQGLVKEAVEVVVLVVVEGITK